MREIFAGNYASPAHTGNRRRSASSLSKTNQLAAAYSGSRNGVFRNPALKSTRTSVSGTLIDAEYGDSFSGTALNSEPAFFACETVERILTGQESCTSQGPSHSFTLRMFL